MNHNTNAQRAHEYKLKQHIFESIKENHEYFNKTLKDLEMMTIQYPDDVIELVRSQGMYAVPHSTIKEEINVVFNTIKVEEKGYRIGFYNKLSDFSIFVNEALETVEDIRIQNKNGLSITIRDLGDILYYLKNIDMVAILAHYENRYLRV